MRVIWKWPADDYSADEFVVHYTLDENDIEEDDRMVITDEFFADLPSLKSSTTYLMQIPAPNDVTYAKLNETAVEVKWSPTVANPQWSTPVGYVIQVQTSSTSIPASEIVVDGIKTSRYVLTVQPHVLYTIRNHEGKVVVQHQLIFQFRKFQEISLITCFFFVTYIGKLCILDL
uniref:Fibronectin type-III domain-containing protein n=1 Tax=Parascaris equorum TaxID=6256 RepID=A0A914RM74_PAREQ